MAKTSSTRSDPGLNAGGGCNLLQDQAYVAIKERLISGELEGGALLSERQIAQELGMSKTPVKAAFTRLDQEGYLKISPQHGVVVHNLTKEEIRLHMDLRIAIESHIVRVLAETGLSADQSAAVEKHLREQSEKDRKDEISDIFRWDAAYHLLLCQFVENPEMLKILSEIINKQFRPITDVLSRNPIRRSASLDEHRAIASAIQEKRGHLALELMVAHLERGKQLFMDLP